MNLYAGKIGALCLTLLLMSIYGGSRGHYIGSTTNNTKDSSRLAYLRLEQEYRTPSANRTQL